MNDLCTKRTMVKVDFFRDEKPVVTINAITVYHPLELDKGLKPIQYGDYPFLFVFPVEEKHNIAAINGDGCADCVFIGFSGCEYIEECAINNSLLNNNFSHMVLEMPAGTIKRLGITKDCYAAIRHI